MKFSEIVKIILLTAVISTISVISIFSVGAKAVDIDGNGSIGIGDATEIQKALAGLFSPPDDFYNLADVDEDGSVSINDVTYIQKYLAGLIDEESSTEPTSEPEPTTDAIQPSKLSLNETNITLGISEEFTLIATCDVENYKFKFSSENSSVAEVNDEGIISAVSEGTTTIVCSTENGLTADCSVTVKPMATNLILNKNNLTLGVGEQFDLDSSVDSGTAAYYRNYNSDNPDIASVEESGGLITANAVGTTTISCILNNGVTAKCSITVKPLSTSLTINKENLTLGVGEKFDFNSSIDNGTAAYHRYYYSDNPDVATVEKSGGLTTAKSVGKATISCVMSNGLTATCNLTVKAAPNSVSLNTNSVTLKVGNTYTISESTNSGSYAYGFEWSSSNPMVATITKGNANKAVISAMMLGTTNITIKTYNGKTATCKVTISDSAVKCLDVSTWQGTDIDFNKVKASGIDYVILRAGYGEETYQKDDTFEINYKKAKQAGMKVGAYWFSYAMSPSEATKEANACLYCIKGKTFDLPVYYDMEYEPAITQLNEKTYTSMAANFCNTIKNAGYKSGVYASASVFGYPLNYDKIVDSYSIWNAEWNSTCTVSCDIWQYTDQARVNGISENVDLSYIFNLNIVG